MSSPRFQHSRRASGLLPALLAVAAAVALTTPCGATMMRRLSVADLASHADAVVRGRVVSVEVVWNRAATMPLTQVELEVLEVLSGELPPFRQVLITQPGGEKDGVALDYAGRPEFEIGEEAVLFLAHRQGRQFITVGLAQGKFQVSPAGTRSRLSRRLAGVEFVEAPGEPPPGDLVELRQTLRALPRDLSSGRGR